MTAELERALVSAAKRLASAAATFQLARETEDEEIQEYAAEEIELHGQSLCRRLVAAGIDLAEPLPGIPSPRHDLAQLALLDSREARALLEALELILPVAEALDAQRGRTMGPEYPVLPDESRGTDFAEVIALMRLRLRGEIYGPAASVTGGRE